MQAVILAGGKGTRLAERLNGRPKPLVDVDGVPLLERQIASLRAFGIDQVVILVNHAADQIATYCAERHNFGLASLILIDDGAPRGTAGAVLACLDHLQPRFLIVYGDTLFNIDIRSFLEDHVRSAADITLFLHPNDHPQDSDLIALDDDGFVAAFHSKPHAPGADLPNMVNAAFYAVERQALEAWRDYPSPADFGHDLFPAMLAKGARLRGYVSFEYIKDLGTPKRLDKVTDHLRRGVVERATLSRPQACVFIDRDGTLNRLSGYIRSADELVLLPGAAEAVRRFNDAEFRVVVITNQPVLARGECTFAGLRTIHARLDRGLAEAGAYVDRLYFCPHHPDGGYPGEVPALKVACACRKPGPGMIHKAAQDLNADLSASWVIGDTTGDMEMARRLGLRAILVRTGEAGSDAKYPARGDIVVDDAAAAAEFILDVFPRLVDAVASLGSMVGDGGAVLVKGPDEAARAAVGLAVMEALKRDGRAAAPARADDAVLRGAEDRILVVDAPDEWPGSSFASDQRFVTVDVRRARDPAVARSHARLGLAQAEGTGPVPLDRRNDADVTLDLETIIQQKPKEHE